MVTSCSHFLLFLTEGVSGSKWVQMEIRRAITLGMSIILVMETDTRHGSPEMTALIENAPEDIQHIFTENVAIPWYRDPAFREVSLDKIACRLKAGNETSSCDSQASLLVYGDSGEAVLGAARKGWARGGAAPALLHC